MVNSRVKEKDGYMEESAVRMKAYAVALMRLEFTYLKDIIMALVANFILKILKMMN